MVDSKLDANGDLALENGRTPLVRGTDYRVQRLMNRLGIAKGEWDEDLDVGFPWFEEVLGQKTSPERLEALFRAAILSSPGIASLDSLEVDFDPETRTVTLDGSGTDIDGEPFDLDGAELKVGPGGALL